MRDPLNVMNVRCPRCYDGTDPRLDDQSCVVCWGAREVNLIDQTWPHQHSKLLQHLMMHPNWESVAESLRGTKKAES
jgi:hypothetical protein